MTYQDGQFTRTGLPTLDGAPATAQPNARVYPRFYMDPRMNSASGNWEDVEMCEMLIAGDVRNQPVKKVTDGLRQQYAREYALFKQGLEQSPTGFPIEQWLGRNSASLNMKAKGILTVEQLAELPDNAAQDLQLGGRAMVERARAFIAMKKETDAAEKIAAKNVELNDTVELLKDQLRELSSRLDAKDRESTETPAEPARRGRPPNQPRVEN